MTIANDRGGLTILLSIQSLWEQQRHWHIPGLLLLYRGAKLLCEHSSN